MRSSQLDNLDTPAVLLSLSSRHCPNLAAKSTRALLFETNECLPPPEEGAGLVVKSRRLTGIKVSYGRIDVDNLLDCLQTRCRGRKGGGGGQITMELSKVDHEGINDVKWRRADLAIEHADVDLVTSRTVTFSVDRLR